MSNNLITYQKILDSVKFNCDCGNEFIYTPNKYYDKDVTMRHYINNEGQSIVQCKKCNSEVIWK